MVIVRLMGGLGNQLFQYAAGLALSIKNECELKIDLSAFENQYGLQTTLRNPDILHFSLSAKIADAKEASALRDPLKGVSRASRFVRQKIFKQYYSDWHPEVLNKSGDIYLEGYFQCEKYFQDYFDQLSKDFKLRSEFSDLTAEWNERISKLINPVSLHVRRGDYVSDPRTSALHNICTVNYYLEAIEEMRKRIGNYTLVVFSDDVEWVRENLTFGVDTIYVSGSKLIKGLPLLASQELIVMSQCAHHIISNSTFSWWGAYLNKRQDKVVLAPSLWNRSSIDSHKNILPDSWIRIQIS